MKRKILAVILALGLLFATACTPTPIEVENNRLTIIYQGRGAGSNPMVIIRDNETGCQYLNAYEGGIVLLVDEEGKPLIDKKGE